MEDTSKKVSFHFSVCEPMITIAFYFHGCIRHDKRSQYVKERATYLVSSNITIDIDQLFGSHASGVD